MGAIHVIIGEMPPLLRSLVEGVLDEDPRFDVVPEIGSGSGPGAGDPNVEVLILSEEAMKSIMPLPVAQDVRRALGVVAIGRGGLDATVVRLEAHRRKLDEEPRQTLSQAILDAAGVLAGSD